MIVNPKLAFINFWHYVKKHQINWTLGMGSHINFLINTENNSKTKLKGIVIGGMRLEAGIQKNLKKNLK